MLGWRRRPARRARSSSSPREAENVPYPLRESHDSLASAQTLPICGSCGGSGADDNRRSGFMGDTVNVLEHARVNVNVLPSGALGRTTGGGLSAEQADAIAEIDQAVTDWLAGAPERAAAFLTDPATALAEALGEAPSPEVVGLLTQPPTTEPAEPEEPDAVVRSTATKADVAFVRERTERPAEEPRTLARRPQDVERGQRCHLHPQPGGSVPPAPGQGGR